MSLRAAVLAALLYGLGVAHVNPAAAAGLGDEGRAAVMAVRAGPMSKLVVHDQSYPPIEGSFYDTNGNALGMDMFAGQLVIVNFWATWCPPCRYEMPGLNALAAEYADDPRVEIVTIAHQTDRPGRMANFMSEIGADNLTLYHDTRGEIGRGAGILGLPVTLFIAPDGYEIARVIGDTAWDGPEARAVIDAILANLPEGEG